MWLLRYASRQTNKHTYMLVAPLPEASIHQVVKFSINLGFCFV